MYLNIQTGSLCSIKNLMVGSMDMGASFQSKTLKKKCQMSSMHASGEISGKYRYKTRILRAAFPFSCSSVEGTLHYRVIEVGLGRIFTARIIPR